MRRWNRGLAVVAAVGTLGSATGCAAVFETRLAGAMSESSAYGVTYHAPDDQEHSIRIPLCIGRGTGPATVTGFTWHEATGLDFGGFAVTTVTSPAVSGELTPATSVNQFPQDVTVSCRAGEPEFPQYLELNVRIRDLNTSGRAMGLVVLYRADGQDQTLDSPNLMVTLCSPRFTGTQRCDADGEPVAGWQGPS